MSALKLIVPGQPLPDILPVTFPRTELLTPKIRAAAEDVGALERLAPIKELVGDQVSYEQLRAVIDYLKVETK